MELMVGLLKAIAVMILTVVGGAFCPADDTDDDPCGGVDLDDVEGMA